MTSPDSCFDISDSGFGSAAESTPCPTPYPTRSTSTPVSTLRTSSVSDEQYERTLWRHFPGWAFSERARETRCWAWQFGYDIQKEDARRWICRACIRKNNPHPRHFEADGIHNAYNHLFNDHGIRAPPGMTQGTAEKKANSKGRKPPGQRTLAESMKLDLHDPREQAIANDFIKRFDKEHFRRLLIDWIVAKNHSFSIAEEAELHAIFDYLNPSVSARKANITHTTVREKIVAAFEQHKQKVIEVLGKAPGLIHISFDGWRSGNRYALYGICCFFRDENNKPCKITLGLPEVSARHTGPNIAAEILDVIESYQIQDKIGYFTLDNAKNNDTAMEIIGGELGFVGARRRGRCFGHTLNLSAKAILFGHDADAFERRISGAEPLTEAEHLIWRKKGPAGKLHNLVVAIHRSDLLTGMLRNIQQEAFNKSSDPKLNARKPLDVILDNDTRWLSQLYMIRRALLLRDYIERLIAHHRIDFEQQNKAKRGGPKKSLTLPFICQPENQLSDKDWEVVEIFAQILSYYEATIKMLEGDGQIRKRKRGWTGSYGNIWDVIQGFEFLLEQLERFKDISKDFPDTEHFRININLGWQKLNEYYEILSETPIYYTGLALHPAYRWKWFERNWTDRPEWIDEAKNMVHDVWRFEYREATLPGQEPSAVEPVPKQRKTSDNPFQEYLKRNRYTAPEAGHDGLTPGEDEYLHWITHCESGDGSINDPLAYWHEKRFKYPNLSRMALDFLTIQPMSAECERLFSAAGRMVNPLRHQLEAQIIGMCQVLRSWLRAGIIHELDPFFISVDEEKVNLELAQMSDQQLEGWATKWLTQVVGVQDEMGARWG
ncbi:putative AC9 transposase [Fusarium oxysporum f. sp. rapae]|uniref:Putative AC9 transposase n=4 Tax=Fusarium oxysporum f. sp. rapae TaxID=485398 RepID=A0A8J5TM82_FUSOX|nr:putative AC9 transposase [Fusarium oxysporum f. sp. rapae]KAG7409301.1 putative AC9 transposase [Fusarium oxysporum f. sp. rapae]KAG7409302.1 putative AC9 transposase [Fusarium oxysporum f. sp. rapae]